VEGGMNTSEFPIYSLNREEKREHLLTLLGRDYSEWIQDGIIKQTMHGLSLAWHFFPHQWSIPCGNMLTPMEVFSHHLENALARRRALGACESASDLRKALRCFSGAQGVSNFHPAAASALYHRYLPSTGGVVWDMSAGFGGRLLGSMVSPRAMRYVGTDPCSLTFDGLMEMKNELPDLLNVMGYPSAIVDIYKIGSEDYRPEPGSLSLCMSSPPYAGHEKYSDEPTQSYIKFPTNKLWMNKYMRMTLENCRVGLKRDGFLVMNLANTATYPTLTKDFLALARDIGFTLMETLQLALSKMVGTDKTESHKHEPVYVFRKTDAIR
jgi:hypothetical protein